MKVESVWNDSEDLKNAVRGWADRIGVEVREVHLRDMRRKWASISTNGRLTLNTDLLDLPEALGEFVIVHELVHLLAPNHGVFKSFMCSREFHVRILGKVTFPIGIQSVHYSASPTANLCLGFQMPTLRCGSLWIDKSTDRGIIKQVLR